MKKSNKFIAIALAGLISAGTIGPAAISAKTFSDVTEKSGYSEQIDVLSDIGVIQGTSKTEFSPEDDVTREQMAMLLFRLMLNKTDGGKTNTSQFVDLYDETYHGAISWAAAARYILGTEADKFEPTGGIMLQDAMTMLVRALGQESTQMNKGYPWTYIDAAIKLGLDKGLEKISYTDTLTRAETAVILYNALTAEYLVPKTLSNGVIIYEKSSIIEEVFGYDMNVAKITATNDYTMTGTSVVKNGYVVMTYTDDSGKEKSMAVKFSDLGLEGEPNDWLGQSFKLVYLVNSSTKLVNVLSSVSASESEHFDTAKVDSDNKYVTIDGTKYYVVEEYSETLATNNNEILVYAYDNDGTLEQVKTTKALGNLLGIYDIELIYENESETASIAIVKNYKVGKLEITKAGKINLADDKTEEDLTGGYMNTAKAESGEYVLYYYNSTLKSLEIAQVLKIKTGTITRLTDTTAKVDGETYNLGNANAGISADSIRTQLTVGRETDLVMYKDTVVAVVGGITVSAESEYLLTMSAAVPVYTNGDFRYVVTANIGGVTQNIFVSSANVEAGKIYRYVSNNETYTLIAPETSENKILGGAGKFVQYDSKIKEIAVMATMAEGDSITLNGAYYTLKNANRDNVKTSTGAWDTEKGINFVTDSKTVIIAQTSDGLRFVNGYYASSITLSENSKVTAIFRDEAGSIETLRFLYVTNATLGNYDANTQYVKVISYSGAIYENGRTYSEYNVFNFATGAVEVKKSTFSNLEDGKTYRTGTDGTIVNSEYTESVRGFVSGYTSTTITVDGETYKLTSGAKIISVAKDLSTASKEIADIYMKNVQFTVVSGTVKSILLIGAPEFQAVQNENAIEIGMDITLAQFDMDTLALNSVKIDGKEAPAATFKIEPNTEDNKVIVTPLNDGTLAAGEYTISFKFGGQTFTAEALVTAQS